MTPRLLSLVFCLAPAVLAQPTVTAVLNAGSFGTNIDTRLNPGVLASITGTGFTASLNVSVTVYGLPAPVIGSPSATGMTVQFPFNSGVGLFDLVVTVGTQQSQPFKVTVTDYAPDYIQFGGAPFSDGNFTPFSASHPANPGKQITAYMTGLGATAPPSIAGQIPATFVSTAATPVITIGGKIATIVSCGLSTKIVGTYQVIFTLPPDVSAGNQPVVFSVGGASAPAVSLATTLGIPDLGAISNGATFQVKDATHGAAPNSFVSVFASNMPNSDTANTLFPATAYQSLSVLFNNKPAPLYFVFGSTNQINLVLPSELPETGSVNVNVQNVTGPSAIFTLTMAPTDVGIFALPDPGNTTRHNGAVLTANTAWRVMPASQAKALGIPACTGLSALALCGQPASVGDAIQIYFTGGGKATPNGDPTKPPLATGSVAPLDGSVIYKTVLTPTLTIGGVSAQVLFSGIAPGNAGLYQVNTVIPPGVASGDDLPIVLTFGATSDTATIAVK
jgi:uncharacterized protein (TIGR03437 family)